MDFIGGVIFTAVVIGMNKTITNTSYIYPLIPFDLKNFADSSLEQVKNNYKTVIFENQ